MKLSQYNYDLNPELLAKYPTDKRDESRMLVLHRKTGEIEHKLFKDIINYFDEKDVFVIKSKIEIKDEKTGSSIIILPDEKFSLNVLVHYDSDILFNQYATLEDMEDFKAEIASSRTFVFVRELEALLSLGLIKGGDLQNALVIYETPMSQEGLDYMTDKLGQPRLDATKLGYLSPLNYPNEPARHKLLDLIGDMSLLGCRIQGKIIALRPGHTFNTQCAKRLRNKVIG